MGVAKPNNHSTLFQQDGGVVRKLIEPHARFTREEAGLWASRIRQYAELLITHGVPISSYHEVVVEDSQVFEMSNHGGVDLQTLLVEHRVQPLEALAMILRGSRGVLFQVGRPIVGIDPHPANWCVDSHGNLMFVDLFPSYFVEGDIALAGFPLPSREDERDLNVTRYYTRFGLARLLRFNFVRICGVSIEPAVLAMLADVLGDEVRDQMGKCRVEKVRHDRRALHTVVSDLTIAHVDDLREIAMVLAVQDKDTSLLDRVLKLTTVDFRFPRTIRERRLEEAKTLLLSRI